MAAGRAECGGRGARPGGGRPTCRWQVGGGSRLGRERPSGLLQPVGNNACSTGAALGGELGVKGFAGGPFLALAKGDGRMYGGETFLSKLRFFHRNLRAADGGRSRWGGERWIWREVMPVSVDQVMEKIKKIIVDQLGVEETAVVPGASFVEDLGADSLDVVEMIMAFEEELDLDIPDEDAEKIATVQDVIDYIRENSKN